MSDSVHVQVPHLRCGRCQGAYADGKFYLNSRELSNSRSATLQAALERTLEGTKRPIVIQSDAESPVQSLVTAMDVVGRMGLPQVSIATTHPID